MLSNIRGRLVGAVSAVAVTATVVGLSVVTGSGADAQTTRSTTATAVVQPGPNTVGTAQLKNQAVTAAKIGPSAVWGSMIHTNTIPLDRMGWDFRQAIAAADVSKADAIKSSSQIKAGTVDESDLNAALQAKLVKTPAIFNFGAKSIAKIGGPFKANKTLLGDFTLPAGTWRIDMSYLAVRTVAGAPGTRPQLALRVGASATENGAEYGTVMGAEISPAADRELTATGWKYILKNDSPKKVEVFAFGYNDDGSSAGSAELTMSAQVAITRS